MLNRRHRLHFAADFRALRQTGARRRHPVAVLLFLPNEQDVTRFGFSASRRVGNAVTRNRAKRLLREAVRRHMADVRPGWDCLFIARQTTPHATLTEVDAGVLNLLQRAQILPQSKRTS